MNTFLKVLVILTVAAALVLPVAAQQQTPPPSPTMSVSELQTTADNLSRQKAYSEAATYYRAAIAKDRKNATLHNKLGIAELQQRNYPAAQGAFNTAIKYQKNFPEPYNNLGVVFFIRSDYNRAVKNYKKALALNEGSASFHSNLGAAWFAQKKYERAMAEYSRAVELDPDVLVRSMQGGMAARVASPEDRALYNYILAKMYAKSGDIDRAVLFLQKAKEEGYGKMNNIYVDEEFAALRTDQRIQQIVPPVVKK